MRKNIGDETNYLYVMEQVKVNENYLSTMFLVQVTNYSSTQAVSNLLQICVQW